MAKYSGTDLTAVYNGKTPYVSHATLSVLGDGGWLVSWLDDATLRVSQQRYDAAGHSVGGETKVETGIGTQPVALSEGGWLSVEYVPRDDGVTDSIFLQRYDEDGHEAGPSTLVNTYVQYVDLGGARATELADGSTVVTWSRHAGSDENDIRQQHIDADGNKIGSETRVSSNSDWSQRNSQVTALSNGGWVAMWTDAGEKGGGIYQRAYDADGKALGAEHRVQKYHGYEPPFYCDAIATPDGGWRLSWSEYDEQQLSYEIVRQSYDALGKATGVQTVVDVEVAYGPIDIALLDNGGWAIASTYLHNGRYQIRLQVFDESGEALGRAMLVDRNAAPSNMGGPQVEALDDGRLAVVWNSYRRTGPLHAEIKQEIFSPVENHAPTAKGEEIAAHEHEKVIVDVLANDRDNDHDKLTIDSVSVVSGKANVVFDENGKVTLTGLGDGLIDGETGTVVIQYKIYDGFAYDTANLEVNVTGITNPGDKIFGTDKDDAMVGKNFWEQLFGKGGNDTINGRGGSDILYGGNGSDTLIGGSGDDTFVGGRGDDLLVGGDYADYDLFVFHKGDGNDTIQNLRSGIIDLSSLEEFRDVEDLRNHMHQNNKSLVIDLAGDNSITLDHYSLSDITRDTFIV